MSKESSKNYYSSPDFEHNTGDVWKGLPTFGLLKTAVCSGIVITPACDLANNKVETVTYLPVVPINYFFVSRSFYPAMKQELLRLLNLVDPLKAFCYLLPKNQLPQASSLEFLLQEAKRLLLPANKNYIVQIEKGLQVVLKIIDKSCTSINISELKDFFGSKKLNEITTSLIKNNFGGDIHFLPKDNEDVEWSAILNHSVVLFRYPITVPIEILDLAMDFNIVLWKETMLSQSSNFSSSNAFENTKPLKSLSLRQAYLSDLLTRFVSVYMRLGSPDFSYETINELLIDIK
jgi:hypothetical protein